MRNHIHKQDAAQIINLHDYKLKRTEEKFFSRGRTPLYKSYFPDMNSQPPGHNFTLRILEIRASIDRINSIVHGLEETNSPS